MDLTLNLVLPGLAWFLMGAGLLVALLELQGGGARNIAVQTGQALAHNSWVELPSTVSDQMLKGSMGAVDFWFGQSEHNFLAGGLVLSLLLAAIPIAAFLNAMQGGSPFLLKAFGVLCLLALLLMALGEGRGWGLLKSLMALTLFAGIFMFVPGFVLVSLTERLLGQTAGQAAIGALLVFPLVYVLANSLAMVMDNLSLQRHGTVFLSALAPAYLLSFLTFGAGPLTQPGWTALFISMGANVLSLTWTLGLMSFCRRWPTGGWLFALVLSGAGGYGISLALRPWNGPGPLLPFFILVLAIYLGFLGKLAFGGAGSRPLLAGGLTLMAGGGLLFVLHRMV